MSCAFVACADMPRCSFGGLQCVQLRFDPPQMRSSERAAVWGKR
jgi:hypothetical protein